MYLGSRNSDAWEIVRGSPTRAGAEEVEILGGSMGMFRPDGEHHRPLQDEFVGVGRVREPVEQAFQAVANQDKVELLPTLFRELEEAVANGVGKVLRHDSDSMYGFITRATREAAAARRRSSIERPRLLR